jgi:hypothetical protein
MNKVSALSVLSNAVLVWNTERIAEIASSIETSSGKPVPRDELERVSPFTGRSSEIHKASIPSRWGTARGGYRPGGTAAIGEPRRGFASATVSRA